MVIATFAQHAPALFGLSEKQAVRLRSGHSSWVIGDGIKIARHLAATQGGSAWSRLRSQTFIDILRTFTRSRDVVSRLCFAALDGRQRAVLREMHLILFQVARKLPFGERILNWIRRQMFPVSAS
jgi:hypothetical protein